MAITTEITTIQATNELPTGYSRPATTITFSGTPVEKRFQHTLAAATYADPADPDTTVGDILTAIKAWIDATWIPNTLKLNSASTINGIVYVEQIERKNNQSDQYLLGQDSYIVTGVLKYE